MKDIRLGDELQEEDLCHRCGVSCHPAVKVGVLRVVLPDVHCQFLETDTDGVVQCAVYEDRFERAPWCLSASEAKGRHLLSQDCGYHRGKVDRSGKAFLRPRLLASIRPQIVQQILEHGVPHWVTMKGVDALLEAEGFVHRSNHVDEHGTRWIKAAKLEVPS